MTHRFSLTLSFALKRSSDLYSIKTHPLIYKCLTEKLYLIRAKKPDLLNKRTELIYLNADMRTSFT